MYPGIRSNPIMGHQEVLQKHHHFSWTDLSLQTAQVLDIQHQAIASKVPEAFPCKLVSG